MRWPFTKMQAAGNDFVVLDCSDSPFSLTRAQLRHLADRRYGVGGDQVLVIEPAPTAPDGTAAADITYRIFNGDGREVEHCGNGARCVAHLLNLHGRELPLRAQTVNRRLTLSRLGEGRYAVAMGAPQFNPADVGFDIRGLARRQMGEHTLWQLPLDGGEQVELALVSMGNPHAVLWVPDVVRAPVERLGPLIGSHPRFAQGVNVSFMQQRGASRIALRVYERGAGETPSCGSGACAAAVTGLRLGLLTAPPGGDVAVRTRGGELSVQWAGEGRNVTLGGPARTVFEGEIDL